MQVSPEANGRHGLRLDDTIGNDFSATTCHSGDCHKWQGHIFHLKHTGLNPSIAMEHPRTRSTDFLRVRKALCMTWTNPGVDQQSEAASLVASLHKALVISGESVENATAK